MVNITSESKDINLVEKLRVIHCDGCNINYILFYAFDTDETVRNPHWEIWEQAMSSYCPYCGEKSENGTYKKSLWVAKDNSHVSMYTDRDQFIAQIQGGLDGETYLSVGYSSPNCAEIENHMILDINKALNEEWNKTKKLPLKEMLSSLLKLCEVANQIYNNLLFK